MINSDDIKITGWWGDEPIWRFKTAEERALDQEMKPEQKAKLEKALLLIKTFIK